MKSLQCENSEVSFLKYKCEFLEMEDRPVTYFLEYHSNICQISAVE
jgi:hypothetical protein